MATSLSLPAPDSSKTQVTKVDPHARDFASFESPDDDFSLGVQVPAFAEEGPSPGSPAAYRHLRIERYEIREKLGEGAIGEVFKAYDKDLDRIVAIKVLNPRFTVRNDLLERFKIEAKSAAQLHDQHIVQVYDIGTFASSYGPNTPYIAMEYVSGGTLLNWQYRQPVAPTRAAELIEPIARAVALAHEKGIIHRDIKPSNILLTEQGEAKLSDFGLARRSDALSTLTDTGVAVGTPQYMSPEQALGKPNAAEPASDIFSLGTVLYELLTGQPAFRGVNALGIMDSVVKDDPVMPGLLQPRLTKDIVTICMKCLEKEPAKRYTSASALADDLQRFLKHEPIHARPMRWYGMAWRWCKRQPRVAALTVLLVLAIVASFFTITTLYQQSRERANSLAESQITLAQTVTNLNKQRQQLRLTLDELSSGFIEDSLLQQEKLTRQHRDFLGRLLRYYQDYQANTTDQEVDTTLADGAMRVARLYRLLGEPAESLTAYARATQLYLRLAEAAPIATIHRANASACLEMQAEQSAELGKLDEAITLSEQAIRSWEQVYARSKDINQAVALMRSKLRYNKLLVDCNRVAEAEQFVLAILKETKQLANQHGEVLELKACLVDGYSHLITVLRVQGKNDESLPHLSAAKALLEQLSLQQPAMIVHPHDFAKLCLDQATAELSRGHVQQAEQECHAAYTPIKTLLDKYPSNRECRVTMTRYSYTLATILIEQQQHELALKASREALTHTNKLLAYFPEVSEYVGIKAKCLGMIGCVLQSRNEFAEARQYFLEAADLSTQLYRQFPKTIQHPSTLAGSYCNVANTYVQEKQWDQALQYYQQAMNVLLPLSKQSSLSEISVFLSNCYVGQARVYSMINRCDEAYRAWSASFRYHAEKSKLFGYDRAVCLIYCENPIQAVEGLDRSEIVKLPVKTRFELATLYARAVTDRKDAVQKNFFMEESLSLLRRLHQEGQLQSRERQDNLRTNVWKALAQSTEFKSFLAVPVKKP